MIRTETTLAGLDVEVVDTRVASESQDHKSPVVVLLHGFSMTAADLSPFGASIGVPAIFVFPQGPLDLAVHGLPGRAWWMIDAKARGAAIARGDDRDLSNETPAGLPLARERLTALLHEVARLWPHRPLFVGGFSQGAILSLDVTVRNGTHPAGLILLSGARVEARSLTPLLARLKGLPVFQCHGKDDRELSFAAAVALQDDLVTAGADVTWRPFDGGHEIPLIAWRELRKFILRKSA